jgi:hypothetical protein
MKKDEKREFPSIEPKRPPPKPSKKRPVSGPALPESLYECEHGVSKRKGALPAEDFIGPSFPDKASSAGSLNNALPIIEQRHQGKLNKNDGKPKREEWMVVPPTSQLKVDPLNLKNRQFNQSSRVVGNKDLDNSLWTETAQQKYNRIVRGKSEDKQAEEETKESISKVEKRRQQNLEQFVVSYNNEYRGKSLMDEYISKRDPSSQNKPPNNLKFKADENREGSKLKTLNDMGGLASRFKASSSGKYM